MLEAFNKIKDIYLKTAIYSYDFDLLSGIVEKDIIDKNGKNFTQGLGLKAPCTFDELIKHSFSNGFLKVHDIHDAHCELSQEYLLEAYKNGIEIVEKTFYSSLWDIYTRIDYFLIKNEKTAKPHVYAYAYDISKNEKNRRQNYDELLNSKLEIDDIVSYAGIGIWHIYLCARQKARLKMSEKMMEVLGIKNNCLSEEELYEFWINNIKKSSKLSVDESIKEMIEKGFAENTYVWQHKSKGELFMRFGGKAVKVDEKTFVLSGYHRDITHIVNAETKQKQLLQEALEEVNRQKTLLQEALNNYKEADYDRRRDFLTGLRNRQDMFDMLQDVLSGKRERINAIFLMDIDDFKKLNDNYGHIYGDKCLKKIGSALNNYAKNNDIYFYRYGGEEILAISFDAKKNAKTIAKELSKMIVALNIKRDDSDYGVVTVSIGYTCDNKHYEKMIDKADNAMYQAKHQGKNQFVCFEEMPR